jgi:hypothetical protein
MKCSRIRLNRDTGEVQPDEGPNWPIRLTSNGNTPCVARNVQGIASHFL